MASYFYLADDRLDALVAVLGSAPSRTGRAAVLRLAGLGHDRELLDALDAAVAVPHPVTGRADDCRIKLALADAAGVMAFRMAVAVIEDEERDRALELARAA